MPKQMPALRKSAVRGSRSGRPIMALLDLLGRRWSLRIIWELREQSMTSRALRSACDEASPTVLQARSDVGALAAATLNLVLPPHSSPCRTHPS